MAQSYIQLEYPNFTRSVQTESVTEYPDSGSTATGKSYTSHPNASNELNFDKASTSTAEGGSGRNYKPKSVSLLESYDKLLDELGFGFGLANDLDKRAEFLDNLYLHVDGSVFRYLRQHEKPKASKKWSVTS